MAYGPVPYLVLTTAWKDVWVNKHEKMMKWRQSREQEGGMFCYLVYTERWDLVTSSIGPHADFLHIMSYIMLAAGTAPGSSPVLVRTRRLKDRVTSNRDKDSNSILNLAC